MPLTYTRTFTDEELACLNNDLLDITDWVDAAIIGKISNCAKRMEREWMPLLQADPTVDTIPASRAGLIAAVIARPDYMNRVERAAASDAAAAELA